MYNEKKIRGFCNSNLVHWTISFILYKSLSIIMSIKTYLYVQHKSFGILKNKKKFKTVLKLIFNLDKIEYFLQIIIQNKKCIKCIKKLLKIKKLFKNCFFLSF